MKKNFILPTIEQLSEVADEFLNAFPQPGVFCFYGSMGAGKIHFYTSPVRKAKSR